MHGKYTQRASSVLSIDRLIPPMHAVHQRQSTTSSSSTQSKSRLFQLKGEETVLVRRVHASHLSMNQGDAFVLDAGKCVYVWFGPEASPQECAKAVYFANILSEEECGAAPVITLGINLRDSPPSDSRSQIHIDWLHEAHPITG
jgi:hypothetical protein